MLIDFQLVKKSLVFFFRFPIFIIIFNSSPRGEWNIFTGDQLGIIFASKIFQNYKLSGQPLDKLAMVASTVSSKMLARMAEIEGIQIF
jgi:phosphomannomutase